MRQDLEPGTPKRPTPRIIAVAGGKGGVGKSTIAANLALMLGRLGRRVVIVDADLGAPNLHTMLGITRPATSLADFFDHKIATLEAARLPIAASTTTLVAGTSRPGSANLQHRERQCLIRAIAKLDADVVIVDIGAGASFNVVDLVVAADLKLFVITPQLPSIHNAYALLKLCVHRIVRRLATDETQQALIDAALGSDRKARTIEQLLTVLRPMDEHLADQICDTLHRFGAGLVANQIERPGDAAIVDHISTMIHDHLMIQAPGMGIIRRSTALAGGLKAGVGTIATAAVDEAVFRRLAAQLLDADLDFLRGLERVTHQQTMPMWLLRDLEAVG